MPPAPKKSAKAGRSRSASRSASACVGRAADLPHTGFQFAAHPGVLRPGKGFVQGGQGLRHAFQEFPQDGHRRGTCRAPPGRGRGVGRARWWPAGRPPRRGPRPALQRGRRPLRRGRRSPRTPRSWTEAGSPIFTTTSKAESGPSGVPAAATATTAHRPVSACRASDFYDGLTRCRVFPEPEDPRRAGRCPGLPGRGPRPRRRRPPGRTGPPPDAHLSHEHVVRRGARGQVPGPGGVGPGRPAPPQHGVGEGRQARGRPTSPWSTRAAPGRSPRRSSGRRALRR